MRATIIIFLAGVAYVLFSFDMDGSDFGLPAVMTTKRLGLFVISVLLLLHLRAPIHGSPKIAWRLSLVLLLLGVWSFLSSFINGLETGATLVAFFSWAFIAYTILVINIVIPPLIESSKQQLVECMALLGCGVFLFTLIWLLKEHGPGILASRFLLRRTLDEFSSGHSRFQNGLFMVSVFPLAISLGIIRVRAWIYGLSLLSVLIFAVLVLQAASRQSAGAIALFVAFCLLTNMFGRIAEERDWNPDVPVRRRLRLRLAASSLILAGIAYYAFSAEDMRYAVNAAFIERTQVHYETDEQGRQDIVRDALRTAGENPILGVGSFANAGIEWNKQQKYTHNGHAKLLADSGFPAYILLMVFIFLCMKRAFHGRVRSNPNRDLWLVSFAFVVTHLVWSANLNDILQEYILFIHLALLLHAAGSATGPQIPPSDVRTLEAERV